MAKIGIIGGSGLYELDGVENIEEQIIPDTPFGPPSDAFISGKLEGVEVVFLARHGKGHRFSPSEINYRANIFEMKRLGVEAILSVSAVGSLKKNIKPLDFVVVDQFVDRTNQNRVSSFFTEGIVAHVGFDEPVAPELTEILTESCREAGVSVHGKGTYICIEGPQFSTKAESNLYRRWGMDVIGMTNVTEAKLAREAEISYATLACVTDYDCWYEGQKSVSVEMVLKNLKQNIENAKRVLKLAIPKIGALNHFTASNALENAIVTDPAVISEQTKSRLRPLINKYIS